MSIPWTSWRLLGAVAALSLVSALGAQPISAQVAVICDGRLATIAGTPGDDVLMGTTGPDVIAGLQGDDEIHGLAGDDVICGGRGSDLLIGGLGFDIIFGAQDDDLIFASGEQSLFPPFAMEDTRGARIFAGTGDDIVYGSNRWDRMQGGPGNDTLFGFAGRDWMRGGPGHDQVIGHGGADDLHGGSGWDWMAADNSDVAVRAGSGVDTCPNLSGKAKWRGCSTFVDTEANPTLPSLASFPAELSGGPIDTYVYRGFDHTGLVHVGITDDLDRRALEQIDRFNVWEISVTPLERGQARAIGQAIIIGNPQFENLNNSISPAHSYYDDAVAWGEDWLFLNDF
ncbi:MAG: hypothetical protein ACI8Y4_005051 [Candidatus Poriferisodalaceae bacterium]|jgi:hypothetical protein